MMKPALLLFFALLAVGAKGSVEDATVQLEELRTFAKSTIQKSINDIAGLTRAAQTYRSNSFWYGEIDIRDTYKKIDADLITIKGWSESKGADISSCLIEREAHLSTLPRFHVDQLTECLIASNIEITDLINNARYHASVQINKVHELEFLLSLCASENLSCILQVVTLIELETEALPKRLTAEVNKADELFEDWKERVQTCTDSKIAASVSAGNAVLVEIAQCANVVAA